MAPLLPENLILFDGICNLCNSSVQFIIRNDRKVKFRFSALQSGEAEVLLKSIGQDQQFTNPESVILFQNGKLYQKSTAALRIAKGLRFPWPILYGFIVVPAFIRDGVYEFIGRNRYRWFGKKDACMIPTPELRARFL